MKSLSKLDVAELKNLLKKRKLSTAGTKAELLIRLQTACPDIASMMASQEEVGEESDREQSEAVDVAMRGAASAALTSSVTASASQREIELYRKEKELIEKELALAKREIEILRLAQTCGGAVACSGAVAQERIRGGEIGYERASNLREGAHTQRGASAEAQESAFGDHLVKMNDDTRGTTHVQRINLTSIAELLKTFDGTPRDYEAWEGQIKLLREVYHLDDNTAKILVGMRLKGRAYEWFHSKPEYLRLSFDELLRKLRRMFQFQQSKVTLRKKFEERSWNKAESIHEYVHDKIILGNKISVPDDEILEYVIEGIPDVQLRDQARIQLFNNVDALLQAFEKISLSDRVSSGSSKQGKGNFNQKMKESHQKSTGNHQGGDRQKLLRRCFNCGEHSHIGAECPSKSEGVKCFKCAERGHVASKCTKKNDIAKNETAKSEIVKSGCAKLQSVNQRCTKNVRLSNTKICALLDTGSDTSLLSEARYDESDLPSLNRNSIVFRGVGAKDNRS